MSDDCWGRGWHLHMLCASILGCNQDLNQKNFAVALHLSCDCGFYHQRVA